MWTLQTDAIGEGPFDQAANKLLKSCMPPHMQHATWKDFKKRRCPPASRFFLPLGGKNGKHLDNDYNEPNIVVGVVPLLPVFPSRWEVNTGST